MESKTANVNDIDMRWEESGAGKPVVLIHGIPTSPMLWRRVIPLLENAHAHAWEMVGYGESMEAGKRQGIGVARQADYLVAWMQAIGLERAVLVGHDLGGGVAQIAAVRHPERVQGLVLTNSISYDSWPIGPIEALRFLGFLIKRLPEGIFKSLFRPLIHGGHDNKTSAKDSFSVHWRYYAETGEPAAAFIRQARSLDVHDTLEIADRLPALNLPVRIVWGASDNFQEIGYGYRLAYDLRASVDRIESGKHFVPEDHPDRIAAAVNGLLSEENL